MKILPTIGRVLWYYPGGAEQLESGEQPRAATIAYVYTERRINIGFLNINGQACNATSVILLQEGEEPTAAGFCVWMPFQIGQAKATVATPKPAPLTPVSGSLYLAIRAAMEELNSLHPGFNDAVNRAFNHLHRAFWSECPAPANEPPLRPELMSMAARSFPRPADGAPKPANHHPVG